jgi:hypothetical protein
MQSNPRRARAIAIAVSARQHVQRRLALSIMAITAIVALVLAASFAG